jgi:hypothetical protein
MSAGTWSKPTRSGTEHHCVEVILDGRVGVRDTKNRAAGALEIPAVSWAAFLSSAKDGKLRA